MIMNFIMIMIKWIFVNFIPIIILYSVWFMHIRPFSLLMNMLDVNPTKELPLSAFVAIDIAVLTLVSKGITDSLKFFFKKPVKIKIRIYDMENDEKHYIKYKPENIGNLDPTEVRFKVVLETNKFYFLILKKIFKGIKIQFNWNPRWLSIKSAQSYSGYLNLKQSPGEIAFDLLEPLSTYDEDDPPSLEGKLNIALNNDFKKKGNINSKFNVNSDKKICEFLFKSFLNMLIDCNVNKVQVIAIKE